MSSQFYFAYGSNMNPARMQARELHFRSAHRAHLPGYELCFNKQSHSRPEVAYANIRPASGAVVEGVLYQLADTTAVAGMDVYEGTPVRYSRECVHVWCDNRPVPAWVYMANPAYINNSLLPEERYLAHLLAGEAFLSPRYLARLRAQAASPSPDSDTTYDSNDGLRFNV